jgi:uncharacterized protein
MRWRRVRNPDVIDRRGAGGGRAGFPMGRGGAVGGGLGLVGVLVVIALQLLGGGSGSAFDVDTGRGDGGSAPGQPVAIPPSEDPERDLKDFSTYVFTDAQKTWQQMFKRAGQPYEHARLVLYRDGVRTACGAASSAVGPFYCPGDQIVYLDLSFYGDLQSKLDAGGDFAWAYVIAHELGHHVQQQLGTSEEVRAMQCPRGLRAAGAVGDDRLQRRQSWFERLQGSRPERLRHLLARRRLTGIGPTRD